MTERPRRAVDVGRNHLIAGPSSMEWDGESLTVRLRERTAPLPRRVEGTIRLTPTAPLGRPVTLLRQGGHVWTPFAPTARVDVHLDKPDIAWSGHGYFDANRGNEPLEDGVSTWTWTRMSVDNGPKEDPDTLVFYDVDRRHDAGRLVFGKRFSPDGTVTDIPSPAPARLPTSLWRNRRSIPCDTGGSRPEVLLTAEDSPFYTRSIVATQALGARRIGMHESLDMNRFQAWWMKMLMPVRMPRQFW